MAKGYRPAHIELKHYRRWEAANYFAPTGTGEPYCIVIPPPNVTGTLHMGHAFQDTIMDALIRYHRMAGRNTLWQPGTDHAGISTEMVVERLLNTEGTTKHDIGRAAFVDRVWAWKAQSGNRISEQLKRLGASVDWSRERFTMDPGLSAAVNKVFVQLFDEGLIYRGKRLVHWDPQLHTVLSDLEVLAGEEKGKLWRFRYPLLDRDGYVVVATTRPETMLGDTAVAVHPQDQRYAALVGQTVRLPLAERPIPVIADEYVDPEFGTGCVKITPAHDFNDYEVGLRHALPMINIFDPDAKLNDEVPDPYRGLDRFEARERVVADLDGLGLLDGVDDHLSMVPRGDRSGVVVEPYLTDQWYVRVKPLAKPAIEAVESGRVRFVPENWSKTYFEWMNNIQDWCISRQLWWGHRIPAWYDGAGNVYVAHDEDEARAKHGLGEDVALRRDDDVLDTWFSSALWPFSTMGWPDETPELQTFYPTSVLVTGFDIIFFWVARMIMMGLKFMGDVPFREVYIHGLIRDQDGQKMSKSKGNVLDPLDIVDGVDLKSLLAKRTEGMMQPRLKSQIEAATRREFPTGISAFGTDALRFTFASVATTGRDVSFDLARVEGYHRFCNKLWNAAQYVFGHLSEEDSAGEQALSSADRWIRSQLHATILDVHEAFSGYRLDLAAQALYEFTWHEYCDWYLELTKPVLTDADTNVAHKRGTRNTLAEVLGALLRLLHPLMPFITEEIWLALCERTGRHSETILLEAIPRAGDFERDVEADTELQWLKAFVIGIRQIRGEMDLSPSLALPVKIADATDEDRLRVDRYAGHLTRLARLASIEFIAEGAAVPGAATALLGQARLLVPLAGLIDLAAERERLSKRRDQVESDLGKCRTKLDNPQFVSNAPEAIVAKERSRAHELARRLDQLDSQLARLSELS